MHRRRSLSLGLSLSDVAPRVIVLEFRYRYLAKVRPQVLLHHHFSPVNPLVVLPVVVEQIVEQSAYDAPPGTDGDVAIPAILQGFEQSAVSFLFGSVKGLVVILPRARLPITAHKDRNERGVLTQLH